MSKITAVAALSLWMAQNAIHQVHANPKSRPYVAYRTNPFDQEIVSHRILADGVEQRGDGSGSPENAGGGGRIQKNKVNRQTQSKKEEDTRCPLSFRLGSTHSAHFGASSQTAATTTTSATDSDSSMTSKKQQQSGHTGVGTHTPPIIYPLHPDFDAGSGRQILLTTDYEVLEMWTPSSAIGTHADFHPEQKGGKSGGGGGVEGQSTEQLKEDEQFPLLFESSSFYHSSPIVHDVEGDGIADAILGDYDGNLHLVGLDFEHANTKEKNLNGHHERRKRHYKRISIPRLYVRKSWFDTAINRTSEDVEMANTTAEGNHTKWEDFEPYHTYFATNGDDAWRGKQDQEALRGVSGDVLNMDIDLAKGLAERRKLQMMPSGNEEDKNDEEEVKIVEEDESAGEENVEEDHAEESAHRRLEEVVDEPEVHDELESNEGIASDNTDTEEGANDYLDDMMYNYREDPGLYMDDAMGAPPDGMDDAMGAPSDGTEKSAGEEDPVPNWGDDAVPDEHESQEENDYYPTDDYAQDHYGYGGDDHYRPEAPDGWDSYDQYQEAQGKYYHDSNYLRLPPHLLSTCTLAELPRAYAGSSAKAEDRVDEMVLCAVSYFFDEDECKDSSKSSGKGFGKHANADGGDETEEQRGRYVANALLGYNLRWNYWSVSESLDLSTDWSAPLGDIATGGTADIHSDMHSGIGAWALASPIAVKLEGSERNNILVGTSMGFVYALDHSWHSTLKGWPVQMRHPVEQKVLVEDVVGNTNLEVFVVDAGGDVASLNADGAVLWSRNLLRDDETNSKNEVAHVVRGTSPMSMGDVEGTGKLAIVLLARITTTAHQRVGRPDSHDMFEYQLYAIDAITGDDLPHFPIALEGGSNLSHTTPIAQPLLIDLHEDQHHWLDQLHGLSEDDISTILAINSEASRQNDIRLSKRPHGGSGRGLHVVQPLGSTLHIIEGSTSCEQTIDVGDSIPSMVQADDVHGTGGLDLVVTTSQGEILTLESDVVPYHALNVWSAGEARTPGSSNAQHGFSSTQGIFIHPISRQFRDILGIYVPVTFEIFDRRPNIKNEEDRRVYQVDIRAGMSVKRTIFSKTYNSSGVYTERIQIPYGPGYYAFSVRLRTTHGITYEDTFHVGWNVNYMGGLWLIVCLPLILAAIPILMFKRKPNWEDDEDYGSRGSGILGRAPPP